MVLLSAPAQPASLTSGCRKQSNTPAVTHGWLQIYGNDVRLKGWNGELGERVKSWKRKRWKGHQVKGWGVPPSAIQRRALKTSACQEMNCPWYYRPHASMPSHNACGNEIAVVVKLIIMIARKCCRTKYQYNYTWKTMQILMATIFHLQRRLCEHSRMAMR